MVAKKILGNAKLVRETVQEDNVAMIVEIRKTMNAAD